MATTIMVADSEPLFREGLIQLLATQRDFRVVAEASDSVEAIEQAWREQPDLVLLTLDLPTAGGQETARRIRRISPDIKVIMLVPPRDDDVRAALAEDVHEVVNCSARGTQILERIRSVAESGRPRRYPSSLPAADYPPDGAQKLTPREQEVLALIALAWNNHQIERALGIRNSTVKRHVRHILRKLHARNRVQAAVYAYRQPQAPEEGTPS
jgi:DNA-binding NarL/FixJ family response regulator